MKIYDLKPLQPAFVQDVKEGLASKPYAIPSLHLYDNTGAQIFCQICETPEYYLTRTENALLAQNASAIIASTQASGHLNILELGSGTSEKISNLLQHMQAPSSYCSVDISLQCLELQQHSLKQQYPQFDYAAICVDFTQKWQLPEGIAHAPNTLFFPGSTLGNFSEEKSLSILEHAMITMRKALNKNTKKWLLLGLDICQDPDILTPAYNDAAGVSAQFALNLATRLGKEVDASISPQDFAYNAYFDAEHRRIVMGLTAQKDIEIAFAPSPLVDNASLETQTKHLQQGDFILTEMSHKYDERRLKTLETLDLKLQNSWKDADQRVGLFLFSWY